MKRLIQITSLVSVLALFAACGGGTDTGSGTPSSSAAPAAADHAAEANRTITDENMDSHLEDLEAEIAADEGAL